MMQFSLLRSHQEKETALRRRLKCKAHTDSNGSRLCAIIGYINNRKKMKKGGHGSIVLSLERIIGA